MSLVSIGNEQELGQFLDWVAANYGDPVRQECVKRLPSGGLCWPVRPFAVLDGALRVFEQDSDESARTLGQLRTNS